MEGSGWLWLFIDVVLVAILGLGLAYGVMMWRRRPRDPGLEQARDDATRRLYERGSDDERQRPAA